MDDDQRRLVSVLSFDRVTAAGPEIAGSRLLFLLVAIGDLYAIMVTKKKKLVAWLCASKAGHDQFKALNALDRVPASGVARHWPDGLCQAELIGRPVPQAS